MKTKHLAAIFITLLVVTICFVFYDLSSNLGTTAQFTDNILRPLLGNKSVGFLEKAYFNTSDRFKMATNVNQNIPVDEQDWKAINDKISFKKIKPDKERSYAVVTLARINMSGLMLAAVAGTKQPGGPIGNFGDGKIPKDIVTENRLVAAFDGGFQYRDGEYGMIVGDKTYLPLKNDLGTIVGYTDGTIKIVNYQGQDLGPNISFIRQNCPILIENGIVFAENENNKKLWGRTFNSDIYTWRSGLGIDENGNLIYAVGNNLSPESLAVALKMGGSVNAIQLDINPFWVRFNIFNPNRTLTKDLKDGTKDYINGYSKDFFYVYKTS